MLHSNLVFLLGLTCLSLSSHAINKVGNGGDVVVCKASIQLLDFYETDEKIFSTSQGTYKEILKENFSKLEKTVPEVFKNYQNRLESIVNDIEFKKDIKLSDIKDSNEFYIPKNCELVQIAIRKKTPDKKEKKFIIDQDLWNKLSDLQKAGLISHEIIYEHFAKLGQTDSMNVRKVNRFVFSKNPTASDFWNLIQDLKIPLYPQKN